MRIAPVLRTFDFLMIALLVGVVFWTFKVKNDSQIALDRVADLERKIEAERLEIDLLKSDWSLLTNPARLEQLAERFGPELGLKPVEPSQLADHQSLPPIKPDFVPGESDSEFASDDPDIITGGITPPEGEAAQ